MTSSLLREKVLALATENRRWWTGPAPCIGYVDNRWNVRCLDCVDHERVAAKIWADSCDDPCGACGKTLPLVAITHLRPGDEVSVDGVVRTL